MPQCDTRESREKEDKMATENSYWAVDQYKDNGTKEVWLVRQNYSDLCEDEDDKFFILTNGEVYDTYLDNNDEVVDPLQFLQLRDVVPSFVIKSNHIGFNDLTEYQFFLYNEKELIFEEYSKEEFLEHLSLKEMKEEIY